MMAKANAWALTGLAVLMLLLGAYTAGYRMASSAAEKRRKYEESARAAAGAKGVYDATAGLAKMVDSDMRAELRRDWLRGKK